MSESILWLLGDAHRARRQRPSAIGQRQCVRFSEAERPATPQHTYGFYHVKLLAALTNAVVLLGISFSILCEASERFRHPLELASKMMLLVAAVGLAVNIAGIFILRAGSTESLNLKGAYFGGLSDMLTSIGVIIAAIMMENK